MKGKILGQLLAIWANLGLLIRCMLTVMGSSTKQPNKLSKILHAKSCQYAGL